MNKRKINNIVKKLNKYHQEIDEMIGDIMSIKLDELEDRDNIPQTLYTDVFQARYDNRIENLREAEGLLIEIMDEISEVSSVLMNT